MRVKEDVDSMKIKYSKEADVLMIELRDGSTVDSIDLKEGTNTYGVRS